MTDKLSPGERRGGVFEISEQMLSEIFSQHLGLDMHIGQINSTRYYGGAEIVFATSDERFPVVGEGERFPELTPRFRMELIELDDGSKVRKVRFDGFLE